MSVLPHAAMLPDGRLRLQHGPIDLVIAVSGEAAACRDALQSAQTRFATILEELCAELPTLRSAYGAPLRGVVARRMQAAVQPHAARHFITPMAAVAGAVADEILASMTPAVPLRRAAVNNGGDIALHLAPSETWRVGLVDRPDRPSLFGTATICAGDGIGGIATSGWRGRSFSLGIADAVTILAATAAEADAAATMVANEVDLPGHPAIIRAPACDIQADTDLGPRLVTRHVGALDPADIEEALGRGRSCAEALASRGLILAAALTCQGSTVVAGSVPIPSPLLSPA